jgi:hypothetical protein
LSDNIEKIDAPDHEEKCSNRFSSFPDFQFIQVMSSTRPIRIAAVVASQRINEYMESDNNASDSDSSSVFINMPKRARQFGYDNSVHIIKYLLNECKNTNFEDGKTAVAEKLFLFINQNPNILIYESEFREVVINKMNEFEKYIDIQNRAYDCARFDEVIPMMKKAIFLNVRHSQLRDEALLNLNKVAVTLNSYSKWNKRTSLLREFNTLKAKLDEIKNHPCYRQAI